MSNNKNPQRRNGLQQMPPVGATWTPPKAEPQMAVALFINVPEHASVRRNAATGQIEIDNIQIADLISLRDSISEQITTLQNQDQNTWEPL
jgi:hypothetical protein